MTPLQFTRSVRGLNRLRQIAQVLTQHGFGHIVAQLHLSRFVPVGVMRRRGAATPARVEGPTIGRRIAMICSELGPTFIKLGQMLSTRPDIIPADVLAELSTLQDKVPPFDTALARRTLAEEFGCPIEQCLAWMGDEPIASGSIGQVYRARGLEGTELVVKVRRPDVEDTIRLDMQVMKWLADSLESVVPETRIYRPRMLVSELEDVLTRELDYVNEASATARMTAAFAQESGIRVPEVRWDLCSRRVLVLTALEGERISSAWEAENGERFDRRLIARRLVHAFLKQVFEVGIFQSDPHPGNLLVAPPATLGILDFGQVGSVSESLLADLTAMVYSCVNREVALVIEALADLGALGDSVDRRGLYRSLQALLDKYYGLPLKRLDLTAIVSEFSEVVRRHDVLIPREVVLLCKAIGMMAGVTAKLDPELQILELLRPRLEQAIKQQFSPRRVARGAMMSGWHVLGLLRSAPSQIRDVLRRAATGAWRLDVRHENIERLIGELDRSSNRLAFSIVIAAIIIGSSVVVSAKTELTVFDIQIHYFGIVGYLIAGVLGLALIWAIFRSGRLH